MTEQKVMSFGKLELRKTDEGWQYLSEGNAFDPEQWCDATDVRGPFAGSGINDLLDELAASKALSARVIELENAIKDIRGQSSCSLPEVPSRPARLLMATGVDDPWDYIDSIITPVNAQTD